MTCRVAAMTTTTTTTTTKLMRYKFATDMPDDAALNVRAQPDVASEVKGLVRAENDIYCTRQEGDWLCVDLPGRPRESERGGRGGRGGRAHFAHVPHWPRAPLGSGINGETWMLRAANDRTLLVPVEESPLRPQRRCGLCPSVRSCHTCRLSRHDCQPLVNPLVIPVFPLVMLVSPFVMLVTPLVCQRVVLPPVPSPPLYQTLRTVTAKA